MECREFINLFEICFKFYKRFVCVYEGVWRPGLTLGVFPNHSTFFYVVFNVFISVCGYECICVHVGLLTCTGAYGDRGQHQMYSSITCLLYFLESLTDPGAQFWWDQLASEPLGSTCLCPKCWSYRLMPPHLAFIYGFWGLNSVLQSASKHFTHWVINPAFCYISF